VPRAAVAPALDACRPSFDLEAIAKQAVHAQAAAEFRRAAVAVRLACRGGARRSVHRRRAHRGIDLVGRRAIVTGCASGIGVETARALASANTEVPSPYATLKPENVSPQISSPVPATSGSAIVSVTVHSADARLTEPSDLKHTSLPHHTPPARDV